MLEIEGDNLVRADHPNNIKRDGVCIYYKESLRVWVISLSWLNQEIFLELTYNNKKMTYNNKKVIVSVIYPSPNFTFKLSSPNCTQ